MQRIVGKSQRFRGLELSHRREDGVGRRNELAFEIKTQRCEIDLALHRRMGDDGLQLGAKDEGPAIPRVIQRLHSQMIARQKERLGAGIPQRKRKHAAQPRNHAFAPRLPAGEEHLGVALRVEDPARSGELLAQRVKIVDFAVEHDGMRPVRARHRLGTAGDVDDGKPAVSQVDGAGFEIAVGIGPAVDERTGHGPDQPRRGRIGSDEAGNAAHFRRSSQEAA